MSGNIDLRQDDGKTKSYNLWVNNHMMGKLTARVKDVSEMTEEEESERQDGLNNKMEDLKSIYGY